MVHPSTRMAMRLRTPAASRPLMRRQRWLLAGGHSGPPQPVSYTSSSRRSARKAFAENTQAGALVSIADACSIGVVLNTTKSSYRFVRHFGSGRVRRCAHLLTHTGNGLSECWEPCRFERGNATRRRAPRAVRLQQRDVDACCEGGAYWKANCLDSRFFSLCWNVSVVQA